MILLMLVKTVRNKLMTLPLEKICEETDCSKAQIFIYNVKNKAPVSNMTEMKENLLLKLFNFKIVLNQISYQVSKIKLLGVIFTSDLKWEANTTGLVKRGNN